MILKLKRLSSKVLAFTLVETLLAIVIIGVTATILVPILQNAMPNNNRTMFKKAYSTLQRSIDSMIGDEENYPPSATGIDTSISPNRVVSRGFNYTAATTNGSVNKFCFLLTQQLNTVGTTFCPATTGWSNNGWAANQIGTFTTTDGISWRLYLRSSDDHPDEQFPITNIPSSGDSVWPVMVSIDVNGSQGPNCSTVTGLYNGLFTSGVCAVTSDCSSNPDQFLIDIRYDGKLHVGGYHTSAHTDRCAEIILEDPTNND